MTALRVSNDVLGRTLEVLQEAGRRERECVVLWLATRTESEVFVREAYMPEQIATDDMFRIPRESIASLFDTIRARALFVAAQVHTHPQSAFHSAADDRWAVVRHVGALSLVLPYFAKTVTIESFLDDAAVFELSAANLWIEIPRRDVPTRVRSQP